MALEGPATHAHVVSRAVRGCGANRKGCRAADAQAGQQHPVCCSELQCRGGLASAIASAQLGIWWAE